MTKKSAGLLFYRIHKKNLEVFLVHPGGPFWAKKDMHAWSIPKGEIEKDELPLDAAIREAAEETGIKAAGNFIELTPVKQKSGKTVYAWALEKDIAAGDIVSNTFEIEWPPSSGIKKTFPEIDKAAWLTKGEAKTKMAEAQFSFIEELESLLEKK